MNETLANVVTPSTTSSVVRIELAAITSGTNASSEPNTNASTASAPPAPIRVSTSTPGPFEVPPFASWSRPVSPTCVPNGSVPESAFTTASGSTTPPNPFPAGVKTRAKVECPPARMK
jgi:hypothetical protein